MITVGLDLSVGELKNGIKKHNSIYTLELFDSKFDRNKIINDDNINDILSGFLYDEKINYAELSLTVLDYTIIIGSFNRVKLKSGKTRWVVSDLNDRSIHRHLWK